MHLLSPIMYLGYFALLHALYLSYCFYHPSFFALFHFENVYNIISSPHIFFSLHCIVYYFGSNILAIILKLNNSFISLFQIQVYIRCLTTITSFQCHYYVIS